MSLYLKATAATQTTDDLGLFTALVSVFGNTDRGGDAVQPGAFSRSISEWKAAARRVPLHYNHDPDEIIGDIDEMWESDAGLEVSGRVDLDDELGRKVWKSLKRGRIAFSFGFLTVKSRERPDGVKELLELDIFEVSVTASPMNNMTRVLSTKSMDEPRYELPDGIVTDYKGLLDYTVKRSQAEEKAARPIQVASFKC